jgi:hypothetical protein
MKLLSDFDGVWTDPGEEAAAQGEVLDGLLAEWAPPARASEVSAWVRAARASVQREPERYGWVSCGRLTAFADEDPFTAHSALLHFVHANAASDPIAADLRDAIAARGHSLESLSGLSHARGVAHVTATRGPGILRAAALAGERLLRQGAEIVVVSNSDDAKLTTWFGHAGLPHTIHPERRQGSLRLRGSARKFELDPGRSEPLEMGETRIETARPHYERALLEERPDAVVGDVFSLDLALPLRLRRGGAGWSALRLFWILHGYTPRRMRERVSRHAGREVDHAARGLESVADALLSR